MFLFLGYAYDSDCIYVNGTGEDEYEFYIQLNRCGTLGGSDHHKKRNANAKNRYFSYKAFVIMYKSF